MKLLKNIFIKVFRFIFLPFNKNRGKKQVYIVQYDRLISMESGRYIGVSRKILAYSHSDARRRIRGISKNYDIIKNIRVVIFSEKEFKKRIKT